MLFHMNLKKSLIKILATFMIVLTMFIAPFTQIAQAAPLYGWGSNAGTPSAANALSAYILGNGVAGRSSGTFISLDLLEKLNNKANGGNTGDYAYGVNNNIDTRGKAADAHAIEAVNNLKMLYDNGYIQAFENGDDIGAKQGALALAPAALGASVFSMAFGLVQSIQQSIVNINPVNVFGLTDDSTNGVTGGMTPHYAAEDGILGGKIKELFANAGVDASLIRAFAGLALTIMIALFVLALVHGLRNISEGKNAFSKAGQFGLRVLTILFATPFAIVLISGLSTLSGNTFQAAYQSLGTVNDDLIVDSLQYAGLTNYDTSLLPDGGKAETEGVKKLNEEINKKIDKKDSNDIGIDKLVGYVSGNSTFTVNDYLAYLGNSSNKAVGRDPAFLSGMTDQILGYGKNYNKTLAKRNLNQIYDFSQNGADKDDEGNKDVKERIGAADKVKTGDDDSDGANKIDIPTTSDAEQPTWFISLPSDKLGSVTHVSLNNPKTYLYAANAAKDGSNEELNTNSYVWGGKSEKDSMAAHPWDGSKLAINSDDDKDNPFIANMVARAYVNANAGDNGHNFTNQSMIFMLQSKPNFNDNGEVTSITYKAANTGGTPGSESASTGTNTYKFARYVIPHSNKNDSGYLVGAYSKLNVTWVAAGWAALLGLLSLVTGVLVSSIVKVFKGYIRAQFTGDFFGLLDMSIYLIGATCSFMMFAVAVILGSIVTSFFTNFISIITNGLTTASSGIQSSMAGVPIFGFLANGVSAIITTIIMAMLSLITVAILTYPVMKISVGGGESRTCNIVDLMITIPLSVAAMISDWLNAKKAAFYGDGNGIPKLGESTIGDGFDKSSIAGGLVDKATTGAVAGLTGAAVLGKGIAHAAASGAKDGITAGKDAWKSGQSLGDAFKVGGGVASRVGASLVGKSMSRAVDTAKNFKPTNGDLAKSAFEHFKDVNTEMKTTDRIEAIKGAYNDFEYPGLDGVNNSQNAAEVAVEGGMNGLGADGAMHNQNVPSDVIVSGNAASQMSNKAIEDKVISDHVQNLKKQSGGKKSGKQSRKAKKAAKKQEQKVLKNIATKIEKQKALNAEQQANAQAQERVQSQKPANGGQIRVKEDRKFTSRIKKRIENADKRTPGKNFIADVKRGDKNAYKNYRERVKNNADGMQRRLSRLEKRADKLASKKKPKQH